MKNLKKLSRNELKKVNGGNIPEDTLCLTNSGCGPKGWRYVDGPYNGGFECC